MKEINTIISWSVFRRICPICGGNYIDVEEHVKQEHFKEVKRQGMNVLVNELRELADDLESQTRQFNLELDVDEVVDFNKKWSISIINKEPKCSDTWTLEK